MDEKDTKTWHKKINESHKRQEEFRKELEEAFPIFWRKAEYPCMPSVGPGWRAVLWQCSEIIEKELQALRPLFPVDVLPTPDHMKEKFGALRLGIRFPKESWQNDDINLPEASVRTIEQAVLDAERLSTTVCEYCGSSGELRGKHPNGQRRWVKTLCDDCWEKDQERF